MPSPWTQKLRMLWLVFLALTLMRHTVSRLAIKPPSQTPRQEGRGQLRENNEEKQIALE